MNRDTWHMTWQEQLGSAVFFYALLPAFIIFGIWLIVENIKRDQDEQTTAARNLRFAERYYLRRTHHPDDIHPDDVRGILLAVRRDHDG